MESVVASLFLGAGLFYLVKAVHAVMTEQEDAGFLSIMAAILLPVGFFLMILARDCCG